MKRADLEVFVQSVPNRPVWDLMKLELESSDIGTDYTRLVQAPEGNWRDHFLSVLEAMRDSTAEFVVRFEDDCIGVNRHIKHNLLTWNAIRDPIFGAGWGYHPGHIPRSDDLWHFGGLAGSLCTLFRTEDMPAILEYCKACPLPQDIALSQAVADMKKQICVHGPSLVQHSISVPSAIGNVHGCDSTSRCYESNWKR